MDIRELTTWSRLSSLNFDVDDAALPFSSRLARENGWSRGFAEKAIDEYRKFCFLAAHAGHPVTPSDEIDQVWHLHLTYSRHYWDTLCRDTLEHPLHHGPTQGGAAEDRKFHSWYEATLASYRRYFGEPPNDVWPAARERFHERNDFVRINRRDVVTLDRKVLVHGTLASLAGGGMLACAHAVAQTEDTSSGLMGIGFVVAIVVALMVVFIVAASRSRRRRKAHQAAFTHRANDGGESSAVVAAGTIAAIAGAATVGKSPSNSDGGGHHVGGDSGGGSTGGGDGGGAGAGDGGGGGGGGGGCGGGV